MFMLHRKMIATIQAPDEKEFADFGKEQTVIIISLWNLKSIAR